MNDDDENDYDEDDETPLLLFVQKPGNGDNVTFLLHK